MGKEEKKEILSNGYDFIDYSGFLMTEYREYRLKTLAQKIKSQNYKPRMKLYGY